MHIIDERKLLAAINGLRNGRIAKGGRWETKDKISLEEALDFLEEQVKWGFLKFEVERVEYMNKETGFEIVQYLLMNEIGDLEYDDPCGAPWIRVKLRNLKSVFKNLPEWWGFNE